MINLSSVDIFHYVTNHVTIWKDTALLHLSFLVQNEDQFGSTLPQLLFNREIDEQLVLFMICEVFHCLLDREALVICKR